MRESSNLNWHNDEFACAISALSDDTVAVMLFDQYGMYCAPIHRRFGTESNFSLIDHVREVGEFLTWDDLEDVQANILRDMPEKKTEEVEQPQRVAARIVFDD